MIAARVPFDQAVLDITGGNQRLLTTEYKPQGAIPVIDQGQAMIAGFTDDPTTVCRRDGPVILFGDHTRVLKFVDFDFALGADGVKVLKPRPGFNARFLFHFLRTVRLPENVGYSRHFKFLKGCSVPKPTPDEQQRIATILDKADNLRQKRQEAICLVDKFLRAVFIDMFGDPETNPKSFNKGTIRDLVSSANYGTSEKASEQSGKYPILRMNNITYEGGWDFSSLKYVDLDDASAHKYMTRKGDLLFNRTNSKELVGKTAVYMQDEPMAIAGYLVRVRMNEEGNAHYVSGYLNSVHGKRSLQARAKSIVGMANINAQEMQDIPLLLPPIELQNKFADIVEAVHERLIKQHDFSRAAEALHAALSEKFFSQIGEKVTEPC